MRLRSPAEFYIKYLVCHPDRLTIDVIKERLLDEGLDYVSMPYLDALRAKVVPPKPFYPDDQNHTPSRNFIIGMGINRLFQPDVAAKMALKVLDTPRAKEFMEAMLLVNAPTSAIATFITSSRGVYCTAEAVDVYAHYFWNVNLLDSTQMRLLLRMRVENAAELPDFKDKKKVLTAMYYKDARTVAAELPYSPTSAMLAQMRLGIAPSRADIAARMVEARDTASLRLCQATGEDGLQDSQKFLNYTNGVRILQELLEMVARPDDQLRDAMQTLQLKNDTRKLKAVHELTAGRHTVDVTPMKDAGHDESDEFSPTPATRPGSIDTPD